jgi:hypothetical protein
MPAKRTVPGSQVPTPACWLQQVQASQPWQRVSLRLVFLLLACVLVLQRRQQLVWR